MSDFKFKCPHCQQSLEAPEDMLGTAIDCPSCNGQIQIPASQSQPDAESASVSTKRRHTGEGKQSKRDTKTKQRFRVERVVFIATAAIIIGTGAGAYSDLGIFSAIAMVGFVMFIIYSFTKILMGIGGFHETILEDDLIPAFDWGRFLLEPLYFLGVVISALIFVGAVKVFQWALEK